MRGGGFEPFTGSELEKNEKAKAIDAEIDFMILKEVQSAWMRTFVVQVHILLPYHFNSDG